MPKRLLLLTGSTGFIGGHVARKLAEAPDLQLICIVREGERHPHAESLLKQGATLVPGDFFDEVVLRRAFDQNPIGLVIHLAAIRGGGNASPAEFERVNVRGTELLLREAYEHRVQKFILCSSVGVYGTIPEHVPAGLETPLRGDNQYHRSKIAAEDALEAYIQKGLNGYVVRPLITYGSGDDGFPQSLVRLVRRHLLPLPKADHQIHLVSVERLAEVFLGLVMKDQPQRIFVGADVSPVSLRDLVDWIHWHFYERPYPRYLHLPDWAFRLGLRVFEQIGDEKWATRMALLSKDWSYHCADTYRLLDVKPVPTRDAFRLFLQDNFPR
jgi:nucleoside-diphosphate-sugar epimerase